MNSSARPFWRLRSARSVDNRCSADRILRCFGGLSLALLIFAATAAGAGETADHRHAEVIGRGIFRDCPDCPEMVVVPAGQFVMGSPAAEPGRYDSEGPQHTVALRWFALGRQDVTVRQYAAFVRETGYEPEDCDWPRRTNWHSPGFLPDAPVVCVSWHDAQAYIAWLNGKVGGSAKGPYRLPSEAEWEYAARAGTVTSRWWGEAIGQGKANCNGCGSPWDNRQIAPAGSFAANPFGLYDMLGNAWQWVEDCWNETYQGAPTDGRAWVAGDCAKRVLRGGSWSSLPEFLRSAARNRDDAGNRAHDYAGYAGFRVAMTLP